MRSIKDYSDSETKAEERRRAYRSHVEAMLKAAGVPAARAAEEAVLVLTLEAELASASLSWADASDPKKTEHLMRSQELKAIAPHSIGPVRCAVKQYVLLESSAGRLCRRGAAGPRGTLDL